MSQTLPEGALILPAELARIEKALDELKKTNDAHASLQVQVNLHVHYEYPKYIQLGADSVLVGSEGEEQAKRARYELAQAAAQPTELPAPANDGPNQAAADAPADSDSTPASSDDTEAKA